MPRFITRLCLIFMFALPMLVVRPTATHARYPPPAAPNSTLSAIGIYPLVASGKTDIAIAACADVPSFQFRSEQTSVFLSQIFVRATKCPIGVSGSWRAVTGAVPGECFTLSAFATETALAEAGFTARAARYSVCVTALGVLSPPQRQSITAPTGAIDTPANGATLQGTIPLSGWAIDAASWSGPGVDQVQVYTGETLLGTATYGQARSDIATGNNDSRYTNSGYTYQLDTTRLTNGDATLRVRYHSTVTGEWSTVDRAVTIANPTVGIIVSPPQPTPPSTGWNVPYYWQGNAQWGGNKIGACTNTIGNVGCALTSLAMIFAFYGANLNPGTLNTCLGKDACIMNWPSSKIGSCSAGKVSWRGSPEFSYTRLAQELQKGPVILQLYNSATGKGHFIVVLSGSGNDPNNYRVNDPGRKGAANKTLSSTLSFWYTYNNYRFTPRSLRLFSGTPAVAATDAQPTALPALNAPQPSADVVVTGAVVVYDSTESDVIIELATESSAGAVADMRIWTDQQPSEIWQPFASYVQVPLDSHIYAQFRDAAGNTSTIIEASVPVALTAEIQQESQQVYLPLTMR